MFGPIIMGLLSEAYLFTIEPVLGSKTGSSPSLKSV